MLSRALLPFFGCDAFQAGLLTNMWQELIQKTVHHLDHEPMYLKTLILAPRTTKDSFITTWTEMSILGADHRRPTFH